MPVLRSELALALRKATLIGNALKARGLKLEFEKIVGRYGLTISSLTKRHYTQ